ncbi:unnamed protein product [Rhizophagus irregularis]|uniref:Uncharacterized protein n=1 Tax=Rhizophagus irregularis TaxID=588596 RepID=A0A2I1GAV7_9GLOM|nr:hypothetical protein RhiirA4_541354 [Rhizophagus irregularis]CAB4404412.1 unnamed protein product [Rhizophagus irregularis]
MATIHITCLDVDDYSHEDALELDIRENETVGNLKEKIKNKLGSDDAKSFEVLKVNSSYIDINEKLAILEDDYSISIKKVFEGGELIATEKVSESFGTGKNYIIIIKQRTPRITFKRCIDERNLVPGDKLIYEDNNKFLEGEIVIESNKLQIRCIKDGVEHNLGSFSKFIKLAIFPSVIGSKNWKNLWIELHEPKENLNWFNFRRRILSDRYNRDFEDATNRMSLLNIKSLKEDTLHDSVTPSRQTEDTTKVNTKGNVFVEPLIKMENDETDVAYNNIRLGVPNVSINNSVKHVSDFFSVNGDFSHGISDNTHDNIDQIYNLLVEKKSEIDNILKSQPVYFIGPCFHEFNDFPSITCWATKSLSSEILEQLGELFDQKFRVVSQMMETTDNGSSDNMASEGTSGDSTNNKKTSESKDFERRKNNKDDEEKDGDSHGNGDDNNEKYGPNTNSKKKRFINISSISFADHGTNSQEFTINVEFHAKIDHDEDSGARRLSIHINVTGCKLSKLLSQNCDQLSQLGYGYSLETVKIGISPTKVDGNRKELFVEKAFYPKEKDLKVTITEAKDKQVVGEVGTSSKLGIQGKISNNNTVNYDEMQLRTFGGHTNGTHWVYEKKSNNILHSFAPGLHSCEWLLMENMHGFRVKITQVLCFEFTDTWANLFRKPKLVKCPKISHTLEIIFNNLEDFNEKFARLQYFHRGADDIIHDVKKNIMPNPTKTESDIINIERSLVDENQKD